MPITRASAMSLQVLDAWPQVSIHSVFDSAINMRAGPRLIICTARALSAPHGLELTVGDLLRLRQYAQRWPAAVLRWHSTQRRISDTRGRFAITAAPHLAVFDPSLPVGGPGAWAADAVRSLEHYLTRTKPMTGFGENWPILFGDGRFDPAISSIIDGRAGEAVSHWLGRGPGLTPSGDDVLVGAIATLHNAGLLNTDVEAALGRSIQHAAAGRTTEISAEYLYYACQGMVAGPLHDLITALGCAGTATTIRAINRLQRFGHTSGMDSTLGVIAASRYLTNPTEQRATHALFHP
jgi:hypothetical protein